MLACCVVPACVFPSRNRTWLSIVKLIEIVATLGLVTNCGTSETNNPQTEVIDASTSVTTPTIEVSIEADATTVLVGAELQLFATVTGAVDGGVIWSTTAGVVDATGTLTAPSVPGEIVVTATSQEDPRVAASLTLTVVQVTVEVTADTTSLLADTDLQISVTVTGSADTRVTWTTSEGTIDETGRLTAPSVAGIVRVTATSFADPRVSASLAFTVLELTVRAAKSPVLTGQQVQCTATLVGTPETTVDWSSTSGTVDASGLFTAPSTIGPVEVIATSRAHPSVSARVVIMTRELPIVTIDTQDVPIDSTEVYVVGTLTIDARDGVTPTFGPVAMKIRGRGNSTWGMPKKPYKIKLNSKADLLGMPADKEWALLANYSDKSLMRTHVAMELGRQLGLAWSPRDTFVEVVLNSAYVGTYSLIETVKVATSRVNVTLGSAGAYLVEVDERLDGTTTVTTSRRVPLVLKEPDAPTVEEADTFKAELQAIEDVLYSATFNDPTTGYAASLDVDSFINWYLVNEIFKNVDANFFSSCFMYKNQGDKLTMGPLWDFDLGAGNVNYLGADDVEGWYIRNGDPRVSDKSVWMTRLFEDSAFETRVRTRWAEIRGSLLNDVQQHIASTADDLAHAQVENFATWPILGVYVWPNAAGYETRVTYASEVDYLRDWLVARINWMDSELF